MKQAKVLTDKEFKRALAICETMQNPNVSVTAVASVAKVMAHLDAGEEFDLILLDYDMPRTNGLQGLAMIQQQYPQQTVGMLSGRTDPQLVKAAIDGGAIGWLPKSMSEEPLLHALRMMAAGGQFIPSEVLEELKQFEDRWGNLTATETLVAKLVADGLGDKEIAAQLDLAPNTVRNHVRAILTKAGVENRTKFTVLFRTKTA